MIAFFPIAPKTIAVVQGAMVASIVRLADAYTGASVTAGPLEGTVITDVRVRRQAGAQLVYTLSWDRYAKYINTFPERFGVANVAGFSFPLACSETVEYPVTRLYRWYGLSQGARPLILVVGNDSVPGYLTSMTLHVTNSRGEIAAFDMLLQLV